ncbi:hypothetical protein AB0K68_18840 [Streptomyces sp. NPDC050698]
MNAWEWWEQLPQLVGQGVEVGGDALVVDGGDVLVLQLGQAGGDLVAAPAGLTGRRPRWTVRGSVASPSAWQTSAATSLLRSAEAATVFSCRAVVWIEPHLPSRRCPFTVLSRLHPRRLQVLELRRQSG